MPVLEAAVETRTCIKCQEEQPLDQFKGSWRRRANGDRYWTETKVCLTCTRARRRAWIEANPERVKEHERRAAKSEPARAAKRRYGRTEKGKAAQQRYRSSAKGRANKRRADREYRKSERGKASTQRYRETPAGRRAEAKARRNRKLKLKRERREKRKQRELEQKKLTANIPSPVLKPYIEKLLREFGIPLDSPEVRQRGTMGLQALADAVDVDATVLRRVLKGQSRSVEIHTVDQISTYADFSLDELVERAEEWALLTGDPWPKGYYSKRT